MIEDEFSFLLGNALSFYSVLDSIFDQLESYLSMEEVLFRPFFVEFRKELLDSLVDGEVERTCWAFVDALESRYDEAGVLIQLVSIILIEFLKYELQVFDGFLIHLKLLVHFADVLNESSEVELRLLDINMKGLGEEFEGIIIPRS